MKKRRNPLILAKAVLLAALMTAFAGAAYAPPVLVLPDPAPSISAGFSVIEKERSFAAEESRSRAVRQIQMNLRSLRSISTSS